MKKLKAALMEALAGAGLQVESGGPWKKASPVKGEKVSLKILRAEAEESGTYRFLGLTQDGEECYGMKLTVELALTLLTPKSAGGEGAETFAERVMELLISGAGGMQFQSMTLEEAEYEGTRDCFCQAVRVRTSVLAWGVRDEDSFRLDSFRLEPVFA